MELSVLQYGYVCRFFFTIYELTASLESKAFSECVVPGSSRAYFVILSFGEQYFVEVGIVSQNSCSVPNSESLDLRVSSGFYIDVHIDK